MLLNREQIEIIVAKLQSVNPGWSSFSDSNFIEDEIKYKRKAIAEAHRLLGKHDLSQLIETGNHGEIIARLKKVGATNLLWNWMPSSGDLGILEQPKLDKKAFCSAIFDLLYGPGPSEDRLDRYLNFVKASDLPNKWTFPTYFLFMCFPETEMFVKPKAMQQFLKFLNNENSAKVKVSKGPSGNIYNSIKKISYQLKEDLKQFGPHDMVDIQSIIFLFSQKQLAYPFSDIFLDFDEAEWAFDLLKETLDRLDVTGPEDERFVITLPKNRQMLRLNFGQWMILNFKGPKIAENRVTLTLLKDKVNLKEDLETFKFAKKDAEPDIRNYSLPIERVIPLEGDLRIAFEDSLNYIKYKFGKWDRCIWRRYHIPDIGEAIYDIKKRKKLLLEGITIHGDFYDIDLLAEDTYLDDSTLRKWTDALNQKGQAILYGPPGTGKTFLAEHLARHLISSGDGFDDLVQFHPAYSYEDFIQGIRPLSREDGTLRYDVVPGRFLEFCQRAGKCQGICVLVIDEINRANLARVFGELMYLLEYREKEIPLSVDGKLFKIPENVRIIGTMNTADRSIALVDHALRRRFAFIKLQPNYETLKRYHLKENTGFPVDNLVQVLLDLNHAIKDPNYEIGISYFLKPDLSNHLESIWKMEIEPYLEEYFFDNNKSVEQFRWERVKPALGL